MSAVRLLGLTSLCRVMQMSRLIMSHMSKEPFKLRYWSLVLMSFTLVNSYLHLLPPFPLALVILVLVLIGYLHYVSVVVCEICDYLHIRCFQIPLVANEKKT